jgi:predicted membrane chloride channel (bestrophin family)
VIVRPRPHWIRLLFVRRGSLLQRTAGQQLFIFTLSAAVVMAHGRFFDWKVTLTSAPFSLMGVALAIFLGFRINASYDRYWEARKQWGTVLVVSFVSYTFFALESLSDEIEEPFGMASNDLALDAIVAGIDASLREMLGDLPPPAPQPDANFILN